MFSKIADRGVILAITILLTLGACSATQPVFDAGTEVRRYADDGTVTYRATGLCAARPEACESW